jgi:hypothetical protein
MSLSIRCSSMISLSYTFPHSSPSGTSIFFSLLRFSVSGLIISLICLPNFFHVCLAVFKGFHVDGSIDGSIQTFMSKCGLYNAMTLMHDGVVPNTHMRGSSQIDFPLTPAGLRETIEKLGLLENLVFNSDHRGMFFDLHASLFEKKTLKK